ncbi:MULTISPECIES: hypothetical protein [Bradyrhizobium]|uniref:Uncharacterized protein n=1 Tax=Bradyrhizobium vignae TaxID=1549949 RepID=A0A2U3PW98_9BRAD|nr:hypothetical protein [Bradyrhizobium vignae]MBP0113416.1 hypothetical protein [Bradyrhizobium vignae]RXG97450.1 hypothetical protein EAV90_22525 [Bradyrhizobium vignae]SPP93378.1 protein of unknown function [Bradyrhizobium vignae]
MSRRSAMFMRARQPIDSALPLRGYFLSVGGMLVCLLWLANWSLPAQLSGRFSEPDPARPPIRIHSDVKPPERVVIDTNQSLPAPSDKEIVVAHSPVAGDQPDRD